LRHHHQLFFPELYVPVNVCGHGQQESWGTLLRVNAALADHTKLVQERRRLLKKADSRSTADALEREIEENVAIIDVLKVQQKELKRGIVPDELKDGEAA
jgi:hypothetical protein